MTNPIWASRMSTTCWRPTKLWLFLPCSILRPHSRSHMWQLRSNRPHNLVLYLCRGRGFRRCRQWAPFIYIPYRVFRSRTTGSFWCSPSTSPNNRISIKIKISSNPNLNNWSISNINRPAITNSNSNSKSASTLANPSINISTKTNNPICKLSRLLE